MFRILRCGGNGPRAIFFDGLLILGLIAMVFVFLRRHSMGHHQGTRSLHQHHDHAGGDGPNEIEKRIENLADMRSQDCTAQRYSIKESVSIVIDFYDYQFYNLKSTISSILIQGSEYVKEIIVIDDGSTLKYIIDESKVYLSSIRKAKLIRHDVQMGQLISRIDGLNAAGSNIVVFLDTNVICSQGWLEPLIDLLVKQPRTIVVPHYDILHDPVTMEYRKTEHNLIRVDVESRHQDEAYQ